MANESVSLGALAFVVQRLEEVIVRYNSDPTDGYMRDALIQRFEFTYELSHKTLKRYLRQISANPAEFDEIAFQDLIRRASQQNLLKGEWPDWKKYRDMRARSSHAYGEQIAIDLVEEIPGFLEEAQYLLRQLEARLQ